MKKFVAPDTPDGATYGLHNTVYDHKIVAFMQAFVLAFVSSLATLLARYFRLATVMVLFCF